MNKHFFIVGGQRCGTTYLHNLIAQHPEVVMATPMRPEPKYFMNKKLSELDLELYIESFFAHTNDAKVLGEKSTSYYEQEQSAELISTMFPDSKIIFLLRDPTKRALSNYFFSVNNGFEKRSLEEVFLTSQSTLNKKPKNVSVNPYNYLGRGEYCDFIASYLQYFPSEQIKVLIFEEFIESEISKLYKFLEVDDSFIPSGIKKVVNASFQSERVPVEVEQCIRKYFQEPNKRLERLLGRSIKEWRC